MQTKEDRIVEASFQLFLRHGYRKVSMSDVAEAAQMSRPSLYASFANKEAIFAELVRRQCALNLLETKARLHQVTGFENRLGCVFDIWLIEPVASVLDSPNAAELLTNCGDYAPQAVAELYEQMEAQLVAVLADYMTPGSVLAVKDTARILRLASAGIKSSTDSLPELRRLVQGLISMVVAGSVGVL